MTQISDFDAHLTTTGLHIILLDAHNGVSIIEFSKGGRLLQSAQKIKQFSIRQDLIQHYNQALFTNTKFNGIHALKGQADKDKSNPILYYRISYSNLHFDWQCPAIPAQLWYGGWILQFCEFVHEVRKLRMPPSVVGIRARVEHHISGLPREQIELGCLLQPDQRSQNWRSHPLLSGATN